MLLGSFQPTPKYHGIGLRLLILKKKVFGWDTLLSTLAHLSPHFSHCVSVKYSQFLQCLNQSISHLAPGQVLVGGFDNDILSSVELFPRPSPDACSIPDLPQARYHHSLSLLSGGRLVVCGGEDDAFTVGDSCLSWVAGQTSWTDTFNMR